MKKVILGLVLAQVMTISLSFAASEIDYKMQSDISSEVRISKEEIYAPVHPTNAEVESAAATDLVTIPDSILEQALADELGVAVGEITVGDMETLTDLILNYSGVKDLTGLEYATNLTSLYLGGSQISDISPLSGLTNLTYLYLGDNQISDISPLSGLTNLTSLGLENNQISDISPLSGLTNLIDLNLMKNQISDISPLSGLTNLAYLNLRENQISDISPLSGLTNLIYLNLVDNQISDISPLSGLTNLTSLNLQNNQISDISPLSGLTNLTYLSLMNNQISDISPLSGLTNLTSLNLANDQISDISPLSGLTNLTRLYTGGQSIALDDITVTTNDEIFYVVTDVDGIEHQVSIGAPIEGTQEMLGYWSIVTTFGEINTTFSGKFSQTVTYEILTGSTTADTSEETTLSDEELIALFEVVNGDDLTITVDQSAVDYSTPGDYSVVFTDTDGNEFVGTLTITDVLPTLDIDKDSITISIDSTLDDVLEQLTYSATEIVDGDLTSIIYIDDSAVDYSTTGDYELVFTVVDEEGNSVSKTITVTITDETTEVVDPETPEVTDPDEATSEDTNDEVTSEDTNDEVTSEDTNDEVTSEDANDVSKEDSTQTSLATTGNTAIRLVTTLVLFMIALFGLKSIVKKS